LRFASLGSGSRGNATLIAAGRTRLLLDCGFSLKETVARLAQQGLEPEELSAIVVTHEHADHVSGVGVFARKFNLPVWMTAGTWQAVQRCRGLDALSDVRLFSSHESFEIDGLEIHPFPVPHDAREPSQFVFSDGYWRVGVLTDVGSTTAHIENCLSGCHALLLECNHDRDLLFTGDYPPSLKERVGGRLGHLDNETAGRLLARLDQSHLRHVVAAHLSEKNNRPELAQAALGAALGCEPEWVQVAEQDRGLPWRELF
jgi:phosphoribosyl 1,2-cyclic phosphodiesterase